MELQRTIMSGDLNGLRQLEHQILEHVNHMYEDSGNGNEELENFSIYWITIKKDKALALEMLNVFINTCQTAFGKHYPKYMEVMAYPGLVGAVCNGNEAIIDILKPFTDEDTFSDIVSTFS